MIKLWLLSGIVAALFDLYMDRDALESKTEDANKFIIKFIVRVFAGFAALVYVSIRWRKEISSFASKHLADLFD